MNDNKPVSPIFQIIMNMLIKKENKNYVLAVASNKTRDFVIIIVQQSSYIYCKKYTLEDIIKINFFKNYELLSNCIEIIVNLFSSKKDLILLEEEEEKKVKISLDIEISVSGIKLSLGKERIEFILPNDDVDQVIKYNLIWYNILFLFQEKEENENLRKEKETKIEKLNQEISDLKAIIEELKMAKLNINLYHNKITNNNNINKDNNFDKSQIINELNIQKIEFIKQKIKNIFNVKKLTFKMIYSAKANGDTSIKFHEFCDNTNNTLVLVRTDTNNIFGGFTSKTWNSMELGRKKDQRSFLFSINKQKIYSPLLDDLNNQRYHVFCSDTDGPCFYAFSIENSCLKNGGACDEIKKCNFEKFEEEYEINEGKKDFQIKELEIFQILFDN